VAELCKLTGVHITHTTPFHPRSDGQTERMNRTLLQMLRTTASDHPKDWRSKLPSIMAAYHMTKHATTSVTPNRARLGREVLLPAAMVAAPPEEPHTVTVPWVDQFSITIRDAHQRVRAFTCQTARTQKTYYDARVRPLKLSPGDLVWLYWPRPLVRQSKRKLQKLWTGTRRIIEAKCHMVTRIKHTKTGKCQTVHVTACYPVGHPTLRFFSEHGSKRGQGKLRFFPSKFSSTPIPDPSAQAQSTPTVSLRRSNRQRKRPFKYITCLQLA